MRHMLLRSEIYFTRMNVETGVWDIERSGGGYLRLAHGEDRIHIRRDDDKLAGERWFFDFGPSSGEPAGVQFRAETEAELRTIVERLIEKHSLNS